jgi:hypothetical protein
LGCRRRRLAEPDQEIGEPEGRHEQDDVGLVDQRPQHDALDRRPRAANITPSVRMTARKAGTPFLVESDQRQRREHHHDALREVEHAGRLEDQHEAERDQRVEHAGDEALPDRLGEQVRRLDHLLERDRRRSYTACRNQSKRMPTMPASRTAPRISAARTRKLFEVDARGRMDGVAHQCATPR